MRFSCAFAPVKALPIHGFAVFADNGVVFEIEEERLLVYLALIERSMHVSRRSFGLY